MLLTVLGLSAALCSAQPADSSPWSLRPQTSDYRTLYERGIDFAEFLSRARHRRHTWHENHERAAVTDSALERARAVTGAWRLFVVAEDRCGDSANTIPYVARLVELVAGLEMRIVDSEVGRQVMESHRTPDGRAATPTVILLDASYQEAGCWVERPAVLQQWFDRSKDELDEGELYRQKYDWYDRDAGQETIREVVGLLEAAASGRPRCDARSDETLARP